MLISCQRGSSGACQHRDSVGRSVRTSWPRLKSRSETQGIAHLAMRPTAIRRSESGRPN
jgi:hypothetical protein